MAAETKFLGMDSSQIPVFSALTALLAISLTTFVLLIILHFSISGNMNSILSDMAAFREELARDNAIRAATAARRAEMTANDNAIRAATTAFRAEMTANYNAIRAEMVENDNAIRAEFDALSAELVEVKIEILRINSSLDSLDSRLANVERLLPDYDPPPPARLNAPK